MYVKENWVSEFYTPHIKDHGILHHDGEMWRKLSNSFFAMYSISLTQVLPSYNTGSQGTVKHSVALAHFYNMGSPKISCSHALPAFAVWNVMLTNLGPDIHNPLWVLCMFHKTQFFLCTWGHYFLPSLCAPTFWGVNKMELV